NIDAGRADDHRARRQGNTAQMQVALQEQRAYQRARAEQCETWIEKEGARAEQQKEAQTAPAIAPAAQMRRSVAPIRRERRRHLRNAEFVYRRFDHHFEREFHPRRGEAERPDGLASKPTQPTIEISAWTAVER